MQDLCKNNQNIEIQNFVTEIQRNEDLSSA